MDDASQAQMNPNRTCGTHPGEPIDTSRVRLEFYNKQGRTRREGFKMQVKNWRSLKFPHILFGKGRGGNTKRALGTTSSSSGTTTPKKRTHVDEAATNTSNDVGSHGGEDADELDDSEWDSLLFKTIMTEVNRREALARAGLKEDPRDLIEDLDPNVERHANGSMQQTPGTAIDYLAKDTPTIANSSQYQESFANATKPEESRPKMKYFVETVRKWSKRHLKDHSHQEKKAQHATSGPRSVRSSDHQGYGAESGQTQKRLAERQAGQTSTGKTPRWANNIRGTWARRRGLPDRSKYCEGNAHAHPVDHKPDATKRSADAAELSDSVSSDSHTARESCDEPLLQEDAGSEITVTPPTIPSRLSSSSSDQSVASKSKNRDTLPTRSTKEPGNDGSAEVRTRRRDHSRRWSEGTEVLLDAIAKQVRRTRRSTESGSGEASRLSRRQSTRPKSNTIAAIGGTGFGGKKLSDLSHLWISTKSGTPQLAKQKSNDGLTKPDQTPSEVPQTVQRDAVSPNDNTPEPAVESEQEETLTLEPAYPQGEPGTLRTSSEYSAHNTQQDEEASAPAPDLDTELSDISYDPSAFRKEDSEQDE
ncbi:MAG: hypothetical protein M1828_006614 [Chrysothrix sp. TS-e1954]|nr:MAG: hypothetical protein M1828_006614 [Chrysothrix sp. TS-e1954]